MNHLRYAWRLCALLLVTLAAHAQQAQVTGVLKDRSGKAVPNISVLLKNSGGQVITYDYSDKEGKYALALPDTVQRKGLLIEVNWLGYKKIQRLLEDGVYTYPLVLEETVIELKEVRVKTKPVIRSSGDTLSYDVSSFSRKEDRSIGDVISHLPGMSVEESGEISFNGKRIENLYIHGDDLMDGRYGLATRVITKEMIKSIDVMQHHQPIRVLKNKVQTDNVAVNLVLKDENSLKLSGQAAAGAGLPKQYDAELNGMMFNRRFKMLNSVKANNSGTDYAGDFQQFNLQNILNTVENSHPNALLSEGIAGNPDLPRKNYYLNQSAVINTNNLYNTKDTIQLRSNIQLFLDRNTFDYSSRADYYLPGDTVHYNTIQRASRKPFQLNTSLTAMVNKSHYYLNDNFRFNFSGYDNNSELDFNGDVFKQRLFTRTYDISNDLQYTPGIKGNDVANVRWYLNFYNSPQQLNIGSGIDSMVLNNGASYAAVEQQAKTPSFISNISTYYSIGSNNSFRQNYQAGIINEWQRLNSGILLTQHNNSTTLYTGDAGNDLLWQRNKLYANASYYIDKKFWHADVNIPVSWQQVGYHQDAYALDVERKYFFVNPIAKIRLYVKGEDYVSATYQYGNSMGNIAGVYRGLILNNYLSLSANDAALQEKRSSTMELSYNYQRNLTMLFMSAGASYNKVTANSILSSVLSDNVQRTVLLPYENDQSSIAVNAGINKYIFAVHTKASLNVAWRSGRYNQFVNGQLLPYTNEGMSINIRVQGKPVDNITINYTGNGAWNQSRPADVKGTVTKVNHIQRYDQQVGLGYSPAGGFFMNVTGRHIYGIQAGMEDINYLFLDANLRYKIKKWRTDVELGLTNLFNIQEYKTAMLTSNQFVFNSYAIRGRMGVIRATFNL